MVARLKRLSMETFRFEIQCPSRDRGLCSGNLLLVDRGGMCVHAQLQTEDRYLSNRMVGENIFDLVERTERILRRSLRMCGGNGGIVRLLCDFDEPIRRLPRYDPAEEYFLLYQ